MDGVAARRSILPQGITDGGRMHHLVFLHQARTVAARVVARDGMAYPVLQIVHLLGIFGSADTGNGIAAAKLAGKYAAEYIQFILST